VQHRKSYITAMVRENSDQPSMGKSGRWGGGVGQNGVAGGAEATLA